MIEGSNVPFEWIYKHSKIGTPLVCHTVLLYCTLRVTIRCKRIELHMHCGIRGAKSWHWHCKVESVRFLGLTFIQLHKSERASFSIMPQV
nr:hypothetical protein CQW23_04873 [Ipomoea batatas]GME09908.1 hypothetical protein CQW23_04873 [Ipomoea batatas]